MYRSGGGAISVPPRFSVPSVCHKSDLPERSRPHVGRTDSIFVNYYVSYVEVGTMFDTASLRRCMYVWCVRASSGVVESWCEQ